MILAAPTIAHIYLLCQDARPDEIEQYEALRGVEWDIDEIVVDLFRRDGMKFSLLDEAGNPVVVGGWEPVMPGVYQSWMVGTDASWDQHWRSITKQTRFVMDRLLAGPARRLQTTALAKRTRACEWYERGLLMQREGILRNMAVTGEDVVIYSRLAPVAAPERVELVEA